MHRDSTRTTGRIWLTRLGAIKYMIITALLSRTPPTPFPEPHPMALHLLMGELINSEPPGESPVFLNL